MAVIYLKLKAEERKVLGSKVKKLRQEGLLPANLYGKDVKSQALQVSENEFAKAFQKVGETGIIELEIGKLKPKYILIHNIQKDPVSSSILHVDFRQVDLAKKITAAVPLELTGEAPAVSRGGVLVQQINEIEVESLPGDLPDKLELDISGLEEINQSLAIENLKYDQSKITLKIDNPQQIVVKIEPPAKEEVEEKPAEAPAEGAQPSEGEAVKEGEEGRKEAEGGKSKEGKPAEQKTEKKEEK